MVIYGVATQTSIGKLLIAGVVPGLIAGVLLAAMIYLWVVVSPKHAPTTYRVSREERWASLVRIWPSLLLIFLVLVLLHRDRDPDRGGRAGRVARRRHRRGVRPAHLGEMHWMR